MGKLLLLPFVLAVLIAASSAFSDSLTDHNRFTRSESDSKIVSGAKSAKKCTAYKEQVNSLYPEYKSQGCGSYHENLQNVGPVVAAIPGEFPFMAAVGVKKGSAISYGCIGALISENYVISPAYCLFGRALGTPNVVRVGTLLPYTTESDAQEVNIAEIEFHPNYIPHGKYDSLGLIKLEKPVTFNRHVLPACLHTDGTHISEGTAVGWRWFNSEIAITQVPLSKSAMVTISTEECSKSYGAGIMLARGIDGRQHLCREWKSKPNNSITSPRGVFVTESRKVHCLYTLISISLFGGDGFSDDPHVDQKVHPYLGWIESIVWP